MPTITFTSPTMKEAKEVYAKAGDRATVLGAAKEANVSLPFDCHDGECGSCIVTVEPTDKTTPLTVHLTDKEMNVLQSVGKLTKEQKEQNALTDLAPRIRLACQTFVPDADITVTFHGDPGVAP